MKTSESLAAIAPALVKASAELRAVVKDRVNPHFKSSYASLDQIMEAVRPTLAKHGLTLVQGATAPHTDETGRVAAFTIETMLLHASGEFITNHIVMPLGKADPQGAGAAASYGRRYGVSALLSLATEDDDDGNGAMPAKVVPIKKAAPVRDHSDEIEAQPMVQRIKASRNGMTAVAEIVDAALERHNTASSPSCPTCGGAMWDNRERKTNPKAPDYKCKDKQCDGVIWPPREANGKPAPLPQPVPAGDFDVDAYAPDDADLPF